MEYFDTDQITAQSVAVEDYYSRFTGPEIDARLAEVMPHVQNSTIHITSAERTAWNGKQPSISDLATIRSGAALGATAVQPATLNAHINNTTMHITAAERTAWNGKQPTITDLGTIRNNATLGATAYGWGNHANAGYLKTHQSLAGYATETWTTNNFAAKSHRHSELYIPGESTAYMAVNTNNKTIDFMWAVRDTYNSTYHSKDYMYWSLNGTEMMRLNEYGLYVKYGDADKQLIRSLAFKDNLKFSELQERPTTHAGYGITDALSFSLREDDESVGTYFRNSALNGAAASKGITWYSGGWFNMAMGNVHLNGSLRIGNAFLAYDSSINALRLYRQNAQGIQEACHFISSGDVAAYNALGAFSQLKSLTLSDGLNVGQTVIMSVQTEAGDDNLTIIPSGDVVIEGLLRPSSLQCDNITGKAYLSEFAVGTRLDVLQKISRSTQKTTTSSTKYLYVTISGKEYRISMTELS